MNNKTNTNNNSKTNAIKTKIANNRLQIAKRLAERSQALDDAKRLRDEVKALKRLNKHLQHQIKTAQKIDIIDQAIRDLSASK